MILLQLLVTVSMFLILRDGLPRMRLSRRRAAQIAAQAPQDRRETGVFAVTLLAVLIPFYGYYLKLGFSGRYAAGYSRIFYAAQMARVDFTRSELPPARWSPVRPAGHPAGVLLIWAIHRRQDHA